MKLKDNEIFSQQVNEYQQNDSFCFDCLRNDNAEMLNLSIQTTSVKSEVLQYLKEPRTKDVTVVKSRPLIYELFLIYNTTLPSSLL